MARVKTVGSNVGERVRALTRRHGGTEAEPAPGNLRAKLKLVSANLVEQIKAAIDGFDAAAWAEQASKIFQRQKAGVYGLIATIVLCTWFLSDLTSLLVGQFIPEPPITRLARSDSSPERRTKSIEDYGVIFTRNLFNSRGLIPGDDSPTGEPFELGGPAIRTSLPFTLVGTMILKDELRSIATIEDRTASMVYPVRVSDEIPSKAKIISIEPNRVIFVNTSTGRREFIDIPEDQAVSNPRISLGAPVSTGAGIEKTSPTNFNVARTEVDKAFSDLNNILTQARAVPNFENGQPAGYKLFQIVPGSIYDKLGLKNGDVIAGVNGDPINDPGKAFELLGQLKTAPHLELSIKRDGKVSNFSYDIR